jgi:hypothetical protein
LRFATTIHLVKQNRPSGRFFYGRFAQARSLSNGVRQFEASDVLSRHDRLMVQ